MSETPKIPRWLLGPASRVHSGTRDREILDASIRIERERLNADRARRQTRIEAERRARRYRAPRPRDSTRSPGGGPLPHPVDRILRKDEVMRLTGLSYTSIYRMMKEGRFPKAHKLSPDTNSRMVGWSGREVIDWIMARLETVFDQEESQATPKPR
jgi:prophage regulatory protein